MESKNVRRRLFAPLGSRDNPIEISSGEETESYSDFFDEEFPDVVDGSDSEDYEGAAQDPYWEDSGSESPDLY